MTDLKRKLTDFLVNDNNIEELKNCVKVLEDSYWIGDELFIYDIDDIGGFRHEDILKCAKKALEIKQMEETVKKEPINLVSEVIMLEKERLDIYIEQLVDLSTTAELELYLRCKNKRNLLRHTLLMHPINTCRPSFVEMPELTKCVKEALEIKQSRELIMWAYNSEELNEINSEDRISWGWLIVPIVFSIIMLIISFI